MWAAHPIRGFAPARKHFHHPALGPLTLDYVKLAALEDPDQHLLTFVPANPDTAARLPELLAHASPHPTSPAERPALIARDHHEIAAPACATCGTSYGNKRRQAGPPP